MFLGAAAASTGVATGGEIYAGAAALGMSGGLGLAVVGGLAAGAAIGFGLAEGAYGLVRLDHYISASMNYDSTLKKLRLMTQSASLPIEYRQLQ